VVFGPLRDREWSPLVVASVVIAALSADGMLFRRIALRIDWSFGDEILRFVDLAS